MNAGEALAFNHLLASLETGASEATQQRGVKAAEYLANRARTSVPRGPVAPQVAALVEDVHRAVEVALWDETESAVVRLGERAVVTTEPTGGVL